MTWDALVKHQDEHSQRIPHAKARIETWQKDIHALIERVEGYVAPLHEQKRVLRHRIILEANEHGLGTYRIEALHLEFVQFEGLVKLTPRSALADGLHMPDGSWREDVSGRVHLSYGALTTPLTQVQGDWCILQSSELVPLTESTFEQAITDLLGIG